MTAEFEPFAANSDGHLVYAWTDEDGQLWACCAYDHGPLCRLCQKCDDVTMSLLWHVAEGNMEVRAGSDGEFSFKLTEKGIVETKKLIDTSPDAQKFYSDLVTSGMEAQFDGE